MFSARGPARASGQGSPRRRAGPIRSRPACRPPCPCRRAHPRWSADRRMRARPPGFPVGTPAPPRTCHALPQAGPAGGVRPLLPPARRWYGSHPDSSVETLCRRVIGQPERQHPSPKKGRRAPRHGLPRAPRPALSPATSALRSSSHEHSTAPRAPSPGEARLHPCRGRRAGGLGTEPSGPAAQPAPLSPSRCASSARLQRSAVRRLSCSASNRSNHIPRAGPEVLPQPVLPSTRRNRADGPAAPGPSPASSSPLSGELPHRFQHPIAHLAAFSRFDL